MLKHVSQVTVGRISCLPLWDTNENSSSPLILPICVANDSVDGGSFDCLSEGSCSVHPNTEGKMGVMVLE